MKCSRCGNEVKEGAKFCNSCGQNLSDQISGNHINLNKNDIRSDNKSDIENKNTQDTSLNDNINCSNNNIVKPKKKIGKKIVLGVSLIVIALIGLEVFSSGDYSEQVRSVKEAYFNNYSYDDGYANIGDSFENYFANTSWDSFTSDDGKNIVEFNGTFQTYGNDTNACIQFEVYEDDSFDIYTITFNDIPQNKFMIGAFIETIMDESQYIDMHD